MATELGVPTDHLTLFFSISKRSTERIYTRGMSIPLSIPRGTSPPLRPGAG
jgi:hypothetical protein